MAELAMQVMLAYESEDENSPRQTFALPPRTTPQTRSRRHFYRQIINCEGKRLPPFESYSAEILAWWTESTHERPIYLDRPQPHTNTPAFDLISIGVDQRGDYYIQLTQVKTTQANLQENCRVALAKFERLRAGDYGPQLKAELIRITKQDDFPDSLSKQLLLELMYQNDFRYKVATVHGQAVDGTSLLTTYSSRLPGHRSRRKALFIKIEWGEFWSTLQDIVNDKLD